LQPRRLTNTSFIVLGLLELFGDATPYELKAAVAASVGNFWTVQHAQLYSEPERLAADGLVAEEREEGGRRRRRYAITPAGEAALAEWRAAPTAAFTELRDPGLLQLFFGADPAALAAAQLEAHEAKLAEYEEQHAQLTAGARPGIRLALEAGIAHEHVWVDFWRRARDG
jgi:PadR family transcriptional regulator, regulatory protein AphA